MLDIYSKIILTVIAGALVALVTQNTVRPASAQMGDGCGSSGNPCYISTRFGHPIEVETHP